jgi:hypothetical protein
MTVDMLCDCTHPKDEHAGLAYACWGNCKCQKYTPDIQAGAAAIRANLVGFGTGAQLPTVEEMLPDARERAAAGLAAANAEWAESTSARLRRVEQERDSLLAHNEHLVDVSRERDDARGELTLARRQRDVAERARDLARAELASACAELQRLRIQLAGVLQFASAWQDQKPPCPHGQPGGERCGPCSFDRAVPAEEAP